MKRSPLHRYTPIRGKTPLKRGAIKRRGTSSVSRSKLRLRGVSEVSVLKETIQGLVRDIVIVRDGGCILRDIQGVPTCNGYRKDGELILQADHLITRSNSATYADTRLIVCVCKGHHGWKRWNEKRYDEVVRTVLSEERVKLWDTCYADRYTAHRTGAHDWKLAIVLLTKEYEELL